MFSYKGTPIIFIADRSFFHDALRTEYSHPDDSEWLLFYSVVRHSLEPFHKILAMSSIVLDKLQNEFRSYPDIPPQIIQVVKKLVHIAQFSQDVPIDYSTIYATAYLSSKDIIPIIVSSVKEKKWLDRIKKAGMELKVKGYTKNMSYKRIDETFPGYLATAKDAREILQDFDPIYGKIESLIKD